MAKAAREPLRRPSESSGPPTCSPGPLMLSALAIELTA